MSAVQAVSSADSKALNTQTIDYLHWRDELLQVMYWMAGEGLGAQPTAAQIQNFLGGDPDVVSSTLQQMCVDGYATLEPEGGYRLTDFGRHQGGRSFKDEFHELTHQAHGECSPDCDFCHSPEGDPSQCPSKQVSHAAAG